MGCGLMELFFCKNIFPALQDKEEDGGTEGSQNSKRIYGLTEDKGQAGKLGGIYFCEKGSLEHDDPGIMDGIAAQRMKRKGKMPVGKCREADSRPNAIISRIHDRGFRGRGNAGLDMEEDEIADDPGQAD